jgi:hypothetical protein
VDQKTINLSDLDIARVSVKSSDKNSKNSNIPQDKLIRYNFLEVFVRLAIQKYMKMGDCTNFPETIERLG